MSDLIILSQGANSEFQEKIISNNLNGTTQVSLQQGEYLKVSATPDQVESILQEGNNLVIRLKDGSKIIIENYDFLNDAQVIFGDGTNLWMTEISQGVNGELIINYNPTSSIIETSSTATAPTFSSTALKTGLGIAAIGGIAAASSGDSGDSKSVDREPPESGALQFSEFSDSGISNSDKITQDKAFKLVLNGQEPNTSVSFWISDDQGKTWKETTADQANLADGTYQFKAVVTDVAGNTAETTVQTITIDTSAVAGSLSIGEFEDTGRSTTDNISQDQSFKLTLTGQETDASVQYMVSEDQGATWQATTADQANLADGTYQFKAVVTDVAGNTAETTVQTITIDTSAVAGSLSIGEFEDTGRSSTDGISQDQSVKLTLTGQETDALVQYMVSKDQGATWQATTADQANLADGTYQFKAVVTDVAGNTAETTVQTITVDTSAVAGSLSIGEFEDTGRSSTDGISQDKSFDLTLAGQESGSDLEYLVSTDGSQTWTATTASQTDLADGTYQFKVKVTDAAGNSSETAVQTVTVDTTAPIAGTLSLSNLEDTGRSATDFITQDKSFDLTLAGQESGSDLEYLVSTDGGQTWTATTASQTDLADGTYQFKVKVTDAAGNSSETAVQTVTVDTTAPIAGTLSLSNLEDTGRSATDFITQDKSFDLTLAGQESGSDLEYLVSTDGGQTWTATTASQTDLADGTYQFKVKVTDAAGNSSETAVQTVTVDTTAPIAGTLSLSNLEDTGRSATDFITQDKSFDLTLAGQESGSDLEYLVSTDGSQTWTATTASQTDLADGTYQFKVKVTDAAGNSSETAVQTVTVDNQISVVFLPLGAEDTGISDTDFITKTNTFELKLGGDALVPELIDYLISTDGGQTWTATRAQQNGLADGNYLFKAIATDVAGNRAETVIQQIIIDTTAPIAGTLSLSNLEDTGRSATDFITQDKSFDLTLAGQESGSDLEYLVSTDGSQTWTATTASQTDLADGTYQFKVKVTDAAGNSSETAVQTVTVDTTAPIAGTLSLSNLEDTGRSATDFITQDKSFDLTLAGQESGSDLEYLVSTDGGQTWTATTASQTDLADGTYQFKVKVTDAAGNSSETAVQTVTVDTTAPIAGTLSLSNLEDTGRSATDFITQDKSFDLTLAGQESGSDLDYLVSTDGGQTWTATTASQTDLADGTYQFKVKVTDAAGNSSETAVQTVTVDTTAPIAGTLSLSNLEDTGRSATDFITQDKSFDLTLAGQESGSDLEYLVSTDGSQTWTATTASQTDLADGTYQFKVKVTDAAGNSSETAVQTVTVDTTAPIAGTLSLSNLEDTGRSATDFITQDKSFDLTLAGQESGSDLEYLVSTDGSQTWTATTASQTDLADGTYQFKVKVTDAAGNSSETAVQTVTVDTTAPIAGTLSLSNLEDTGRSATDFITQDKSFDLTLAGQESGSDLEYLVSTDGSQTWTATTASQTDLADGTYQFKVKVTDAAGNSSETAVQTVTVDNTPPEAGTFNVIALDDTGRFATDFITQDRSFELGLSGYELGTDIKYFISTDLGQTWTATTATQTDLTDGEYQFKAVVTDVAGNSTAITQTIVVDNVMAAVWDLTNFVDTGKSDTDLITFTDSFELNISGERYVEDDVQYYVSTDAGLTWQSTIKVQIDLADGTYLFKAAVTDLAGNSAELNILTITVDTVPPVIGELVLSGFEDLGQYGDYVSKDGIFNLALTRQEYNTAHPSQYSDLVYYVSIDGGQTWKETTTHQNLADGEYQFKAVVTDTAGNVSESNIQSIVVDTTILGVTDLSFELNHAGYYSYLRGVALEEYAYIEVYDEAGNRLSWTSSYESNDLNFTAYIYPYEIGQSLHLVLIDKAGNKSEAIKYAPEIDMTAPQPIQNFMVEEYTSYIVVSGQVGQNMIIEVYTQDGFKIQESSPLREDISFYVDAAAYAGQELSFVVRHPNGLTSTPVTYQIAENLNAADAPWNLNLNDDGIILTGELAQGDVYLIIKDPQGNTLFSEYMYDAGAFSVELWNSYLNGGELYAYVYDPYTYQTSSAVKFPAPLDVTPPQIDNLSLDENGYLYLETEVGAKVKVLNGNGKILVEQTVYGSGTFDAYLNSIVGLEGQNVLVQVEDSRGNIAEQQILYPISPEAPNPAINLQLAANGFELTGELTSIPDGDYVHVYVRDIQGNYLGSSLWNSEAGTFLIQLHTPQLSGQTLYVQTVSSWGGKTGQAVEVIAPIDMTPPTAISDIFIETTQDYQFIVTGKAKPLTTITYKYTDQQYSTSTDVNGDFRTSISKYGIANGELLELYVLDSNGNTSPIKHVQLPVDDTSPLAASDFKIDENGYLIASMEAGSIYHMTVYYTDGQMLDATYYDWSYTGQINHSFLLGDTTLVKYFEITVEDAFGNYSTTTTVQYADLARISVDSLVGSSADDVFVVDHYLDYVQEYDIQWTDGVYHTIDRGGYDRVETYISYDLSSYQSIQIDGADYWLQKGQYVEEIELIGQARIDAVGNDLDNVIIGNIANNRLEGREGNDIFIGGLGSDTVIYNVLNNSADDGGIGQDTWKDFHVGDTRIDSNADVINLSGFLKGYDSSLGKLDDFLDVVLQGQDTMIRIDRDGIAGTDHAFTDLLVLENTQTTLDELLRNHQIYI
ncbi:hypothetical protein A3K93_13790 (plasmid) [Acinetobacter sp. NCu2D-2]|uniref:Ig-like domain-containing protein n=1 Tax=Acinetobacter sp. NCu2D-2 TaxID=1608473 RepID=UPI0007CDF234|nr:Ig-like domain-containing protein [Acinetobacter sp. NCu2D-2]ANF83306.1 hypothetical protein A3K93_13790 [Acinetobacter sp. NCu2D-2]